MIVQKIGKRSTLFTYELPEWNLNLHLIDAEKNYYIIDTGLGSASVEPVRQRLDGAKPVIVINTHYHWDHIWGNWVFKDSMIISHRLCREISERRWDEMIARNRRYIAGEARMLLPNVTFDGELKFEEDGIRIVSTPGHTADSISVLDEADHVLNAGDNIGDTPEDIVPDLDCTKEEYAATLVLYKQMDFHTCISGHNAVMDRNVIDRIMRKLQEK